MGILQSQIKFKNQKFKIREIMGESCKSKNYLDMGDQIFDILVDVGLFSVFVHVDSFWAKPGVEVLQVDHHLSVGFENVIFVCIFEIVLDIEVVELVLDEVDVSLLPVLFVVHLEVEHFIQRVGVEPRVFLSAVVRVWDVFQFLRVEIDFSQ